MQTLEPIPFADWPKKQEPSEKSGNPTESIERYFLNLLKHGRNKYVIRHTQNEALENEALEIRALENEATTNNNTTNNKLTNNNKDYICLEQAPDRSGILLPLVDKSEYDVPLPKIEQWQQTYPAVDIRQELRKMIAWLEANPTRKKNRRGVERFIIAWLTRSQDNSGSYRQHASSSSHGGTGFTNFEQRDYDFDALEQQLLEAQSY